MNVIGLVFSLLLMLSYSFYACWDKHSSSRRLETTYIGHQTANRKILCRYQSEIYAGIRSQKHPTGVPLDSKDEEAEERTAKVDAQPKKREINRNCAKLNLWPLIQKGQENHQILKSLVGKLLRTFYGNAIFNSEKHSEEDLLKAIIASAKELEGVVPLEKLDLKNEALQKCYYKMLKGTKDWNLDEGKGYPSLLDYIKIEPAEEEKICIFHAHPDLLAALFNPKMAEKLYTEIHQKETPLTKELVERVCSEAQLIGIHPEFLNLFEFGQPRHTEIKKTFIAKDSKTNISLRKNLFIGKSS